MLPPYLMSTANKNIRHFCQHASLWIQTRKDINTQLQLYRLNLSTHNCTHDKGSIKEASICRRLKLKKAHPPIWYLEERGLHHYYIDPIFKSLFYPLSLWLWWWGKSTCLVMDSNFLGRKLLHSWNVSWYFTLISVMYGKHCINLLLLLGLCTFHTVAWRVTVWSKYFHRQATVLIKLLHSLTNH